MEYFCHACEQRQRKIRPVVWCYDCEETLCSSCNEHHSLFKGTRDHKTLPYDDYRKLPTFLLQVSLKCPDHGERFQDFCKEHDQPICKTCVKTTHRQCKDIPNLTDIVHNVKSSAIFENVFEELSSTVSFLSKAIKDREENLRTLKINIKEVESTINKKCEELCERIEKFKDGLLFRLGIVSHDNERRLENASKKLKEKEKELKSLLEGKEQMITHASDLQAFFAIKELEKIEYKSNENISELSNEGAFDYTHFIVKFNPILEKIAKLESLGDLHESKTPSTIVDIKRKLNEAQIEVQKKGQGGPPNLLRQLEQRFEFNSHKSYSGFCLLPNGDMVFTDPVKTENAVRIYNAKGTFKSVVKFLRTQGDSWDVTAINENRLAFSHCHTNGMSLINVSRNEVISSIETEHSISGLTYYDGKLICCIVGKGIFSMTINSERLRPITLDDTVGDYSRVACENGTICYTCSLSNTVTAVDSFDGTILFKYKDEKILRNPRGIAMDKHLNIYVTGYESNSLVMVTSDGKRGIEILNKTGADLKEPSSVVITQNHIFIVERLNIVRKYAFNVS